VCVFNVINLLIICVFFNFDCCAFYAFLDMMLKPDPPAGADLIQIPSPSVHVHRPDPPSTPSESNNAKPAAVAPIANTSATPQTSTATAKQPEFAASESTNTKPAAVAPTTNTTATHRTSTATAKQTAVAPLESTNTEPATVASNIRSLIGWAGANASATPLTSIATAKQPAVSPSKSAKPLPVTTAVVRATTPPSVVAAAPSESAKNLAVAKTAPTLLPSLQEKRPAEQENSLKKKHLKPRSPSPDLPSAKAKRPAEHDNTMKKKKKQKPKQPPRKNLKEVWKKGPTTTPFEHEASEHKNKNKSNRAEEAESKRKKKQEEKKNERRGMRPLQMLPALAPSPATDFQREGDSNFDVINSEGLWENKIEKQQQEEWTANEIVDSDSLDGDDWRP